MDSAVKWWVWLREHSGRRGAFLAFLTVLDVSYGYGLIDFGKSNRGGVDLILPTTVWAWIWIGVGAVIGTGIFYRRDRCQFAVAATLKGAWALLYVEIWLVQGTHTAWISALVWLTFAALVLVVAGWPEPPPLIFTKAAALPLPALPVTSQTDTEALPE